jgi:hypothetical protein
MDALSGKKSPPEGAKLINEFRTFKRPFKIFISLAAIIDIIFITLILIALV